MLTTARRRPAWKLQASESSTTERIGGGGVLTRLRSVAEVSSLPGLCARKAFVNKFQLSCLDTETLIRLREDLKSELALRQKDSFTGRRKKFIKERRTLKSECNSEIYAHNSSYCLSPPVVSGTRAHVLSVMSRYLPALVAQDWSDVYACSGGERKFYVYAHVDPREHCFITDSLAGGNWGGTPFYIGKGTGARSHDLKRNQAHGKRIKSILDSGFASKDIVKIVSDGLTHDEALMLEAKLIFFFGAEHARKSGILVNLDIPKTPEALGGMLRYKTKKKFDQRVPA